jgi:hypothetical protein
VHYPAPLGGTSRQPCVQRRSEEAGKARCGELPGRGGLHCCLASHRKRCDRECSGLRPGSARRPGRWHASRMVIVAPCPNGHLIIVQRTGDVNRGDVEQGTETEMCAVVRESTRVPVFDTPGVLSCAWVGRRRVSGCTWLWHAVLGLVASDAELCYNGCKGKSASAWIGRWQFVETCRCSPLVVP